MDVFTMVVLIVLISCTAGVVGKYAHGRNRTQAIKVDDELRGELDGLKSRIEVLEKIVTDGKYRLAEEIAGLEREATPGAAPQNRSSGRESR